MSVTLLCYTDFIKKTSIKTKIKICQSALVNINWFSMPIQISTIKLWNRKTKKKSTSWLPATMTRSQC